MKKNLRRALSLFFVAAMLVSVLAGCSAQQETAVEPEKEAEPVETVKEEAAAEPVEKDPIVVACGGDWIPYAYMENDKLTGFDIEVWEEIGKRLDREIKFEIADMSGMFGMVDAGKADFAARQITVTEARLEKYDFTDIYAYSPYRLTIKTDRTDITCMEDMLGKKMVYNPVSSSGQFIDQYDTEGKIIRVTLEGGGSAWEELNLGRVDGTFTNYNIFEIQRAKGNYDVKQIGDPVFYEQNAYPCLKDSGRDELLEEVNTALREMRADGTLAALSIKWVGADVTVDNVKIEG